MTNLVVKTHLNLNASDIFIYTNVKSGQNRLDAIIAIAGLGLHDEYSPQIFSECISKTLRLSRLKQTGIFPVSFIDVRLRFGRSRANVEAHGLGKKVWTNKTV